MKTYLDKSNIAELKRYIESVLPKKTRDAYQRLDRDSGIQFYYESKVRNNGDFWRFISQLVQTQHKDLYLQANSFDKQGNRIKVQKIYDKFIEDNYKNEYEVVLSVDPIEINRYLNYQVCRNNNVDSINIRDIIYCKDLDEYLSKFDKKNVDRELIERTAKIKKSIDDLFQGVKYDTFMVALNKYQENTNNEQILHNYLFNRGE